MMEWTWAIVEDCQKFKDDCKTLGWKFQKDICLIGIELFSKELGFPHKGPPAVAIQLILGAAPSEEMSLLMQASHQEDFGMSQEREKQFYHIVAISMIGTAAVTVQYLMNGSDMCWQQGCGLSCHNSSEKWGGLLRQPN